MEKIVLLFVYLIYFITPFESVAILEGFSLVKLITILFIPLAFFYYKKIPFENSLFLKLISIYTLYIIFSTIWSIDTLITLKSATNTTLPTLILTLFVFKSVQSKVQVTKIFQAYSYGTIIICIFSLYTYLTGSWYTREWEQRLSILNQDQNELSFLLSMGIVSLTYLIKYTQISKMRKLIYISFAILSSFTILLTGSRTGSLILLIIVFLFSFSFKSRKTKTFIISLGLALGVIIFNYLPESTSQRLLDTSEQIKEMNLTNRVFIWENGIKAFDKQGSYLFGTGFMTFRSLLYSTYGWDAAPHNTYLSTFVELGILGLIIFISIIGFLLKRIIYLYRKDSIFNILLILPLMLAMLTLGTENRRWLFLFGILIIKIYEFDNEDQESDSINYYNYTVSQQYL